MNMVEATRCAVNCARDLYNVLEKIATIQGRMTDSGVVFADLLKVNLPSEMDSDIANDTELQEAIKATVDILKFAKGDSTTETGHAGKLSKIFRWNGS